MAASVAWRAHIGGFAFGALLAVVARVLMRGTRTSITRWSDTYDRRLQDRRVPDIKPRQWGEL